MSSYTQFVLQEQVGTGRWVDVEGFRNFSSARSKMEQLSGTWPLRVVRRAEEVLAADLGPTS